MLSQIKEKIVRVGSKYQAYENEMKKILNANVSGIPHWNEVLTDARDTMGSSLGLKLTPEEVFVEIDYPFDKYFEFVLHNTPKRVLANYLFYRSLLSVHEYIGIGPLGEFPHSPPYTRHQLCLKLLLTTFKRATRFMYSKAFVPFKSVEIARSIFKNLKVQYLKELKNLNYANEVVENSTQYLDSLKVIYGRDDFSEDEDSFEEFYADLNVTGSSLLEVQVQVNNFLKKEKMKPGLSGFEAKKLQDLKFTCSISRVIPRIVCSPTAIEKPYLSSNYPASINYGRFGFIAGHELGHGLLQHGILLDSPRTMDNIRCVIQQYSNVRAYGRKAVNELLSIVFKDMYDVKYYL